MLCSHRKLGMREAHISGSKLTEESHWKLGMDVSGIPGGWSSRKRQWWPEAGEQEAEEGRQGS